jgi:hypothetical protein
MSPAENNFITRPKARHRVSTWLTPGNAARPFLIALVVLVFGFSLWQNTNGLTVSKFHPDESRWINRAHYIKDLLHPTSATWSDSYLVRGQPPMGSYMIGIGLLLQGRDVSTNNPWDFNHGDENNITWNAIYGNMPAHGDLMAARRMNAVLGALTVVFTFIIITWLTNWIGGLVGALFLAINPLQTYLSSMALSDAFLTFDIALAAVVIMLLARRPSWPKAILLGILLGFGASDKLTPLFLSFGLGAFGLLLMADPYLRRAPGFGRAWRQISHTEPMKVRRISWLLLSLPAITCATLVLSYPYLWSAPYSRTMNLINFREYEMKNQARIWPDRSLDTRGEALDRIWTSMRDIYTSTGRLMEGIGSALGKNWNSSGFDQWLEVAGILVFLGLALRYGIASEHGLAFALLGGQALGIALGMRVDFNRYYLPLLLFLSVSFGALAGAVVVQAPRLISAVATRRFSSARRHPAPSPAD